MRDGEIYKIVSDNDEMKRLRSENSRMRIALETIVDADQSVSGTNSEDHWQEDGPMAAIARTALIGR